MSVERQVPETGPRNKPEPGWFLGEGEIFGGRMTETRGIPPTNSKKLKGGGDGAYTT
jgi:hypothetical protein